MRVGGCGHAAAPCLADYIRSFAPGDLNKGVDLKYRVCESVVESGIAIAQISDIGTVKSHLCPWNKGYEIEFDVTTAVSDLTPLRIEMSHQKIHA